jgi:hypothetical protein
MRHTLIQIAKARDVCRCTFRPAVVGTLVGHYKILDRLGAGGMGPSLTRGAIRHLTVGTVNLQFGNAEAAAAHFKVVIDGRRPMMSSLVREAPLFHGRALAK